jgi:hypothetical protein
MGLVLRFPSERIRTAPAEMAPDEQGRVLILPTVRIERGEDDDEADLVMPEIDSFSGEPRAPGSGRRRRTPRS